MTIIKLCSCLALLTLCGCASVLSFPSYRNDRERLQVLDNLPAWPLEKPVRVHWHKHMIPFVEADTDADAAFTIGVVHAHLRLGQMETFRLISAGRISEFAGPFFVHKIDHALRIINLQRSAEKMLLQMNSKERKWLQSYVNGINFFIANMSEEPVEFDFLQIKKIPWTLTDALRVGRLAAADINWGQYLRFLPLRKEAGWEKFWQKRRMQSQRSMTSAIRLDQLFPHFSRAGSNSLVISAEKSSTGSAIMANDPHLGIFMPNFWVLMGYKSPSFHVLGLMLPGVPSVVVGRNKDIAWGGTYMRGVSSHLIRVTPDQITSEREETIVVRGWFDKSRTVRESAKGPILSDAEIADSRDELIALNWVGHQKSNEFGAFLQANRARNWREFRNAFKDYAVAGLNLTYADRHGNIGMLAAIRQPRLTISSEQNELIKSTGNTIDSYRTPLQLPNVFNPKEGFIASANNMPFKTTPPLAWPPGQSDRVIRMKEIAGKTGKISVADIKTLQQDVYSHEAHGLKNYLMTRIGSTEELISQATNGGGLSQAKTNEIDHYLNRIRNWDGHYPIASTGAPAWEIFSWQLARNILGEKLKNEKLRSTLLGSEDWRYHLRQETERMPDFALRVHVLETLLSTRKNARKLSTWGDMHVQRLQSPLGMFPVLGSRFRHGEYPAAGASTTLNKASFQASTERQYVTFGAQSRHISVLNDPDENYFVQLGGNDGWLDNDHLTDQVPLWRAGEYLKLPLTLEKVRADFDLATTVPVRSTAEKNADRAKIKEN